MDAVQLLFDGAADPRRNRPVVGRCATAYLVDRPAPHRRPSTRTLELRRALTTIDHAEDYITNARLGHAA
ncbi:MAG: hypothetical protein WD271_05340 [Acidimicrobiia bacterium]